MNTKVISFANHKGGVGKTTTTANVGSVLASLGKKVLLIDMDAQANLTQSLVGDRGFDKTVYNALSAIKGERLPVYKVKGSLDIVPASLDLAYADLELASVMAREYLLKEAIDALCNKYDYILIDCPPSLGLLTLNAITASSSVIIPLVAEVLPFKGLTMIMDFINMVQKRLNKDVTVGGVLLTRWENSNLSRQIEEGLRKQLDSKIFKTKIRKNIKVAEAPLEQVNIIDYAPKSNGAADYLAFTKEIIEKL
ncbi:MAG: ParA family protein [Prevotella bivia]|nr:ParA family protein [Prevotella bivia]